MDSITFARGNILYTLILIILISCVQCRQKRQFDLAPDLPSHLPSPPKAKAEPSPPANSSINQQQEGVPPGVPPPLEPFGPGILPGELVPFGLNHVILIIVPQFKTKFQKLPAWVHSSVTIAMPVTVFFDQLHVPPEMLVPGVGGIPLLPLGVPPPMFRPPGPVPPPPPASSMPPNGVSSPVMQPAQQSSQINSGFGYYPHKPYLYGHEYDGDPKNPDENGHGYDDSDNYYSTEDEASLGGRRKRDVYANETIHNMDFIMPEMYDYERHSFKKIRRKRAVNFNRTLHKSERATIIPKLEKILNNAGFEGKSCLLRAVCEVHEAPLKHYGLVGEILTLFFSISQSIFSESHLPEYLQAENNGRAGDCTEFYNDCENSMFSWEKSF